VDGFEFARAVLEDMERYRVPPTPNNFELWAHKAADPEGPVALEIARLTAAGSPLSNSVLDDLTLTFVPQVKLNQQLRDAGEDLSRELAAVDEAVSAARKSGDVYSETLQFASDALDSKNPEKTLGETISYISDATQIMQRQNNALRNRLSETTVEIERLRTDLEKVRRDAKTDALTNLANRRAFDEELERVCDLAHSGLINLTVAVIDIDHFKVFNDTWGHQTGDQVLRYVSAIIRARCPAPIFAARYGGEEFALLFPGETSDQAHEIMQIVLTDIEATNLKRRSTEEPLGRLTMSGGLASFELNDGPSLIMERADKALYAAKANGRNQLVLAEGTRARES